MLSAARSTYVLKESKASMGLHINNQEPPSGFLYLLLIKGSLFILYFIHLFSLNYEHFKIRINCPKKIKRKNIRTKINHMLTESIYSSIFHTDQSQLNYILRNYCKL